MLHRSNRSPLGRDDSESAARKLTPEMEKALSELKAWSAQSLAVMELAINARLTISQAQEALSALAELGMAESDRDDLWRWVPTLSEAEAARLEELEVVISRGLKAFYEVGVALGEIRDRQFYRAEFPTFDAYCEQRWGMSRSTVYRKIEVAQVFQNLAIAAAKATNSQLDWTDFVLNLGQNLSNDSDTKMVLPQNEAQTHPLTELSPELQPQAWELAVRTAPNGQITAKHVKKVVRQVFQSQFRQAQAENLPKPKVGDLVQIQLRDPREQDLSRRQYHQQLGIVEEVNELAVSVRALGNLVSDLFVDEVRPAPAEVRMSLSIPSEMVHRFIAAGCGSLEEAIAQLYRESGQFGK